MTDLSLKNKIIAIISYIFTAAVIVYQNNYFFSVVYFACIGLVLFFADKIFDNEKIKEKTLCSFLFFSVSHQTLFQIFFVIHENNKHLPIASSVAIFVAVVFAMTDKSKLMYAIVASPILCFLDPRIALCFSSMLSAWSVSELLLKDKTEACVTKNKKRKKKQSEKEKSQILAVEPKKMLIASALTGIVCFGLSIYLALQKQNIVIENSNYFIHQFKNTIGFVIALIYMLIKLFRNTKKIGAKISFIPGTLLCIVPVTFFIPVYGWSILSLSLICSIVYTGLLCFENDQIIQAIKDDYAKSKYLFWILLLLMLR